MFVITRLTWQQADDRWWLSSVPGRKAVHFVVARILTLGGFVTQGLDAQAVKGSPFVRFLYNQGLEQARHPQPLATAALLSFHDAVEMFLGLAADHLGVNLSPNVNFDGYFAEIKQGAGVDLPGRHPMRRMNRSRVNLKHHGLFPSPTDLEQFKGDVTTFLTDAATMVFKVDFLSLDMIDLVTQPKALSLLRSAETQAGQGDHTEALALLSEAFQDLLNDYADRKQAADKSSPYTLWKRGSRTMFGQNHDPELAKRLTEVEAGLERFQRAFRVLAMGVDYQRYARFELLVPWVVYFIDGHRDVHAVPWLHVGTRNTSSASSSSLRPRSTWPNSTSTWTSTRCTGTTRSASRQQLPGRNPERPDRDLIQAVMPPAQGKGRRKAPPQPGTMAARIPRTVIEQDFISPGAHQVQLELSAPQPTPAMMLLTWDFIARWFASFASADQRRPEQRRNSRGHGQASRSRYTSHRPDGRI